MANADKVMEKKRYVIGWAGRGQVIYGKDHPDGTYSYVDPMTVNQAKKLIKTFPSARGRNKLLIYEIIPLPTLKE